MKNKNNEIELQKGIYIMSVDAADLYKENTDYYDDCMKENQQESYFGFDRRKNNAKLLKKEQKRINKNLKISNVPQELEIEKNNSRFKLGMLYKVKLPASIALAKFYYMAQDEFKIDSFGKQYSDAIINVTFNNKYESYNTKPKTGAQEEPKKIVIKQHNGRYDKKYYTVKKKYTPQTVQDTKTLRTTLYEYGFYVNGVKYVNFMRSSSKARVGSCLFINEKYYQQFIDWARIGLKFLDDEDVDIASIRAYEALILSSIINVVTIKADEILLIDDIYSKFKYPSSVAVRTGAEAEVKSNMDHEVKNCIFDGQGLLDKSVFDSCDDTKGRGMMLLRNRWFKCCCFNTNLHEFLMSEENKGAIDENGCIYDMCGNKVKADKIKMIITPSSLKFLKMSNKFNGSKAETYNYYLSHLVEKFGVVKTEHDSFDYSRILSYQMINSIPLTNEEVARLLSEEFAYLKLLKNDPHVVKWHVGEYVNRSNDAVFNLLCYNDDIANTVIYQTKKNKLIEKYKKRLYRGEIRISNTDYSTMVANPYEMLLHCVGRFDIEKDKTLHNERELYCSAFEDRQELAGFRNPNICAGNVMKAVNVYHEEFDKWFNFTDNIAVMNFIGDNVPDRLQGCDMDSDTILLSSNSILVEKAKIVDDKTNVNYLTPVNAIDGTPQPLKLTGENMADIDNKISKNYIGKIINWSQRLNSYYWKYYNDTSISQDKKEKILSEIYEKISLLSSLSQIEIDKAKKFYGDFNTNKHLQAINGIGIFTNVEDKTENIDRKTVIDMSDMPLIEPERKNYKTDESYQNAVKRYKDGCKYREKIDRRADIMKELNNLSQEIVDEEKQEEYRTELYQLMKEISDELSERTKESEKIKKPLFFKYIDQNPENNIYTFFNCPMDNLIKLVENDPTQTEQTGYNKKAGEKMYKSIESLFSEIPEKYNDKQITLIEDIVSNLKIEINAIYQNNSEADDYDFRVLLQDCKDEALKKLKKYKITAATMQTIIKWAYCGGDKNGRHTVFKENKSNILDLLYLYDKEKFLSVFKKKDGRATRLEQVNDVKAADYLIFGRYYKIVPYYISSELVKNSES